MLLDIGFIRFLAGMYRHDDYHSHPVYQELVEELASNDYTSLHLVHCAYECPSIMDSVKEERNSYSDEDDRLVNGSVADPLVDFDWYILGYCISHFDIRWQLRLNNKSEESIDLLVKGLRSSSIAKERILSLVINNSSISVIIITLKEFCPI